MLYKEDFIERFAAHGYTKKDSAIIMEDFIRTIREILVEKESVVFRGFGSFEVHHHKGRMSKSPTTGEECMVPDYDAPKFVAGSILKTEVRDGIIRE